MTDPRCQPITGLGCLGFVVMIPLAFFVVGIVCWMIFNDQVVQ
jgi:Na+-transporting NADH:ubiquinone oxidoreductase subunit NqrD